MIPCPRCGLTDRYPDGHCRPCQRAASKRNRDTDHGKHLLKTAIWRAENPDKVKAYSAKKYADNPEKYKAKTKIFKYGTDGKDLLILQKGKCAICDTDLMALPERYRHIDHDHTTNKVRGLLCLKCNWGLGIFKDDPIRLQKAIDYLCKLR